MSGVCLLCVLAIATRIWALNTVIDAEAWPEELRSHARVVHVRTEASSQAMASLLWGSYLTDLKASKNGKDELLHAELQREHQQRLKELAARSSQGRSLAGNSEPEPGQSEVDDLIATTAPSVSGLERNASAPSAPVSELPTPGASTLSPAVEEEEPLPPEETEQPSASDDDAVVTSILASLSDNLGPALFLSGVGLVALCLLARSCRASLGGVDADEYARLPQNESEPDLRMKRESSSADSFDADTFDAEASARIAPAASEKTIIQRPKLSREKSDSSAGAASPVSALRRGRLAPSLSDSAPSPLSSPRLWRQTSNDVPVNIFEVIWYSLCPSIT